MKKPFAKPVPLPPDALPPELTKTFPLFVVEGDKIQVRHHAVFSIERRIVVEASFVTEADARAAESDAPLFRLKTIEVKRGKPIAPPKGPPRP
jgi:hypothetical protein